MSDIHEKNNPQPLYRIKGTILKITIPAGTVINILDLIEISSPEAISPVIRVPFLKGSTKLNLIIESITAAGGEVKIEEA